MLLAIDIGNSEILSGIFERGSFEPKCVWRMKTDFRRTGDEYLVTMKHFIPVDGLDRVIVSSVVPPIGDIFVDLISKHFHTSPLIVSSSTVLPIKLNIDNPSELGADRIVNAIAAYYLYPEKNVIITDFGTATTLCLLSKSGCYEGGAIAPGVGISIDSLTSSTAQLPRITLSGDIKTPVGKNTVDCMRSGLILGYASMVEGMIEKFIDEINKDACIIATGGWMNYVVPYINKKIEKIPDLTLIGLKYISDNNE